MARAERGDRYIPGPKTLATLPPVIITKILAYLPLPYIVVLCQMDARILRIVCEQNRVAYFGYRKASAETYLSAVIFGAYDMFKDGSETMLDHSAAAAKLASMICSELGKNR
ncbi:hypothetical protein ABW21_db0205275 [Orbilia brochopaga]|nr:hypothetical protein ABW21_db0205275 [Drechslerella brochopaga]